MRTLWIFFLCIGIVMGMCACLLTPIHHAIPHPDFSRQDLKLSCFVCLNHYPALVDKFQNLLLTNKNDGGTISSKRLLQICDRFSANYNKYATSDALGDTIRDCILYHNNSAWLLCTPEVYLEICGQYRYEPTSETSNSPYMVYSVGYSQHGGKAGYGCFKSVIMADIPAKVVFTFEYPADRFEHYRSFDFGGAVDQQCLITVLDIVLQRLIPTYSKVVLYGGCKGGLTVLRSLLLLSNQKQYDWILSRIYKVVAASPVLSLEKGLININPEYGRLIYWFACRILPNYTHPYGGISPFLQKKTVCPRGLPILLTVLPNDAVSSVEDVKLIREHLDQCKKLDVNNDFIPQENHSKSQHVQLFISDRHDLKHGFIVKDPKHSKVVSDFLL